MKLTDDQINNLNKLVEENLIKKSDHPYNDLSIYKYTERAVYLGEWNEITKMCRGLILNSKYEIIGNCIPKFFNHTESQSYKPSPTDEYKVYEKMDGSLIQVTKYKGELIVSSSSSLDCINSDYILTATKILKHSYQHEIEKMDENNLYIFELIAPLTRVVVNYNHVDLYLLAIRNRDGVEIENITSFKTPKTIDMKLDECINKTKNNTFNNEEGYVVRFQNGERIKIKYNSYLVIHRIISHVNINFCFDYFCSNYNHKINNKVSYDSMLSIPDETIQYVNDNLTKIENMYNDVLYYCIDILDSKLLKLESRKDQAILIMKEYKPYSKILFSMIDCKDAHEDVLNHIGHRLSEIEEGGVNEKLS